MEEGDYEKRAVASMSAVQLITAILEAGPQWEALGLQIRLTNGVAQIFTTKIQKKKLSAFIAERVPVGVGGAGELTHAALEVLACIAIKQPISQGGNRPDFWERRQAPPRFGSAADGAGRGICRGGRAASVRYYGEVLRKI